MRLRSIFFTHYFTLKVPYTYLCLISNTRPLSESAPELSKALKDHRYDDHHSGAGASMRSLSGARGLESNRTLTYDDVALLFRRFRGDGKGTVQYAGPLMSLLDVPSWGVANRKLVKVFQLVGRENLFEKVLDHSLLFNNKLLIIKSLISRI